ncbi:Replicase polyprotein 1ab [Stackebrandtia albiflava]|uniref:Replicase polyprotein 1ab n=1 Tax=Stackebrandtia albiflava TaxID=406432 RepID=UPI0011BE9E1B|nr:Replicase polyprotein 1ab [Stackebrandtia albiflava]
MSADEPTPDPVHARPDAAETEPADEPVEDYDERGEIPVPEDVDYRDLDADTRAGLRSLPKGLAENTGRRLVAAGRLLDEDPERALAHALVARRLASRIAVVREAVGVTAYHAGQWQLAIGELRTAQRLTGTRAHLAMIADAERALGRPERAVDAYRDLEGAKVDDETRIELLIVAAGARRDMGQGAAAVAMLQVPELESNRAEPWLPRLRYAFADALAEQGRVAEAREWFTRVAASDEDDELGAGERLLELEGVAWLAEPDDDDRPVD